ncbi:MAG: dTMP kinase [Ignavibacteriaceae bacterium]
MFISFEGIDFCGKTTQVKLLEEYFTKKGKSVKLIREPGGTEISEKIRSILLDKKNLHMTIESEILLFSAARAQLVREIILPEIAKGTVVITDRFHDSTTAYQGFGRGISPESVSQINKFAVGSCIPDLTFFIDITLDEMDNRKSKAIDRALDRIELSKVDFFNRVREGYLHLAKTEKRFKLLNGMMGIKEIHELILKEVQNIEAEKI